MTPKAVLQYLASNEERFIEELFAYTRIPSISAQSDHADDMRQAAPNGWSIAAPRPA